MLLPIRHNLPGRVSSHLDNDQEISDIPLPPEEPEYDATSLQPSGYGRDRE